METFESKANVKTVNGQAPDGGGNVNVPQISASEIINIIYPVGSVYITVDNKNPMTIFGGTWEAIANGRVLVGAGTGTDINNTIKTFAVGDTGGEYTHTLTENELAEHTHEIALTNSEGHQHFVANDSSNPGTLSATTTLSYYRQRGSYENYVLEGSTKAANIGLSGIASDSTPLAQMSSTGDSSPLNVMQPYFSVNIWQRIE